MASAKPADPVAEGKLSPPEGMKTPDAKPVALPSKQVDEGGSASLAQFATMFRWGWRLIGWAPALFGLTVFLDLLLQSLTQVNAKVVEGAVAILRGDPVQGLAAAILPSSTIGVAFVFLGVGVSILLLALTSRAVSMYCNNVLTLGVQRRLHDKLFTLGPSYHQKHQQGELATLVLNFSNAAAMLLPGLYSTLFVRGLGILTAMGFLLDSLGKVKDMPLALRLGLFAALVAIPAVGWKLSSMLKGAYTRVREKNIALTNELMNSTANPVEVQVMGAQRQRSEAFYRRAREFFSEQFSAAFRNEIATQFQSSATLILQVMFVFSAAYFATVRPESSAATVPAIVGFILLIPSVVSPIQEIVTFLAGIQRSWPTVEVVIDLLETPAEIQDRPGAAELVLGEAPTIELHGIAFSYEPGLPRIFDGISAVFEAGQVTAIVARSGGGKTSLLNLVCRLRDPQEGAVTLDGKDLRDLRVESVRRSISRASQFPLFVVDTIRANFHLAKADATDAELEALCRTTGLWDILAKVSPEAPLDYELPRNEGLSGGERRQLSVTRALIHHPKVLLLDEPTTGVDAISRQALAHCLRKSCRGMTVLLVDHDMNLIRQWADKVCVLDAGKIVEEGSPEELLARPASLYRRLWEDYNRDQDAG